MTRIFNILGLNAKPEEIGFTSSTESAGNMEEVCFSTFVLGYATLGGVASTDNIWCHLHIVASLIEWL